jgi:hypothetical protein
MISTYTYYRRIDYSWENWAKLARFGKRKRKSQSSWFYDKLPKFYLFI